MDVHAAGTFLRTVEPFAGFTDADLAPLAARLRERTLRTGQILLREGDRGAEMYFVARGSLAIVKHITGGVEQVVARVGAGEVGGETRLFDRRPRSATIRAEHETELLVLDRAGVHALLASHPAAATTLLRALSREFIDRKSTRLNSSHIPLSR